MGASGPMYRRPASAADVRWYAYDGGGNVVGEIDPAGNVTASKKHDVFGVSRGGSGSGAAASRHGWQGGVGHVSEGETGLVYMRARYYAPEIGRFQSEDPALHGKNWFLYCGGDCINNKDENGKESLPYSISGGAWFLGVILSLTAASLLVGTVTMSLSELKANAMLATVIAGFAAVSFGVAAYGASEGDSLGSIAGLIWSGLQIFKNVLQLMILGLKEANAASYYGLAKGAVIGLFVSSMQTFGVLISIGAEQLNE